MLPGAPEELLPPVFKPEREKRGIRLDLKKQFKDSGHQNLDPVQIRRHVRDSRESGAHVGRKASQHHCSSERAAGGGTHKTRGHSVQRPHTDTHTHLYKRGPHTIHPQRTNYSSSCYSYHNHVVLRSHPSVSKVTRITVTAVGCEVSDWQVLLKIKRTVDHRTLFCI